MINIDFPFHFDNLGRTATTDYNDHIRDMIEQLLFTGVGCDFAIYYASSITAVVG
jgi:hypothetical protein